MGNLRHSINSGVATLAIDWPATRNAIDITMIREINAVLNCCAKRGSGVRAIVITGSGSVFCSGMDLHSVDLESIEARQRGHRALRGYMDPLILRLSQFRHPIITAMNGPAIGVGMSLALTGDIILATDSASFVPSFTRIGMVPDAGVTFQLGRRVGGGRSMASLLLGETIDIKRAQQWGLVYEVVTMGELLDRAQELANRVAQGPKTVLWQIRLLHATTFEHSLQQQLAAERESQKIASETSDCAEGVRAFFERREPIFVD